MNANKITSKTFELITCFVGLQICFVAAGVMQEHLMTQTYKNNQKFTSSQLLVFCNRLFGSFFSGIVLIMDSQETRNAPLFEFSVPAFSNALSSWCQYEALKYVIFPTQLLAKSFKVIPSMLMGLIINRQKYSISDYIIMLMISVGSFLFALERSGSNLGYPWNNVDVKAQSTWGIMLLLCYLLADSFTGQYQSRLFRSYNISTYQMMLGSNILAAFFSLIGLIQTAEIPIATNFLQENQLAILHVLGLAVFTTSGQQFIFYVVKEFGAVTLAIMMTVRQLFSMFLSCILFKHQLGLQARLGILLVFCGISFQIVKRSKLKQQLKKLQ